jgi:cysteine-rich secretory family protein
MSGPTAQELLDIALINRARLNPAGEAALDGIDLNEGLAPGTITTASKQPLAYSDALLASSTEHSQSMISNDYFSHDDPTDGSTPFTRMTAAGYNFLSAGENIAAQGTTGTIDPTADTALTHQGLFVDSGTAGRGHRTNMLSPDFQEIGTGIAVGVTNNVFGATYNTFMLTEDYGSRSGVGQFLTGIAYNDTDGNGFYSVGEGRSGIVVATSGGNLTTETAGGYSGTIGSGVQTITFSGGDLLAPVSLQATIAAGFNALIDMVGQSTIETSVSITEISGITKIIGLGNTGLTLNGGAGNDTIVSAPGDDIINGGGGVNTVVYSSNRALYTVTHVGSSITVSGPDGTDTVSSVEFLKFADGTLAGTSKIAADFEGNGISDVLFRNDVSGDTGFYAISNGVNTGWHDVGASSTAYRAVGVGDFNGDGTSDILYRNNTNGDTGFYEIVNGATTGWHDVGASSTAYSVVGIGDFNGDGTSDILYRDNSGGDTGFYSIVNGAITGWHDVGASSTAYSVVGVGDFNDDGTSDILYRNNTTGDTGFYEIVNGVNAGWHDVGASSTAYGVVGVGDFLGNGTDDILFRNNSTGDTGFYAINNGVNTGWHDIGASSTAYSVVGTGDYLGNGTADVMFRNNITGDTGFYAIVNGANAGWHDIGASSATYHVAG